MAQVLADLGCRISPNAIPAGIDKRTTEIITAALKGRGFREIDAVDAKDLGVGLSTVRRCVSQILKRAHREYMGAHKEDQTHDGLEPAMARTFWEPHLETPDPSKPWQPMQ